jgi:Sulfotransferase domain
MIRSGSTVQYQVVAELVERHRLGRRVGFIEQESAADRMSVALTTPGIAVLKTHRLIPQLIAPLERGTATLFYTFRDLRAVAVSAMRKWQLPYPLMISRDGWLETAVRASEEILAFPNICTSRYEDIMSTLPTEVDRWAGAVGVSISPAETTAIAQEFSFDAQKERIKLIKVQMPDGKGEYYDSGSLLHHDHIFDGSIDGWKTQLEGWQIRQIERRFGAWLQAHNYPLIT